MSTYSVRLVVRARDCQHDNLNSMGLGLFDSLREVVVPRYQKEHFGRAVASMCNEVQPDPEVDTLLLAIHAETTEPELNLGEFADSLLLHIRHTVVCGVVPMHTQDRKADRSSPSAMSDEIKRPNSTWIPLRNDVPVTRVAAEASR